MLKAFNRLCIKLYCGAKAFAEEERGAVDLVTIVILIAVVVILAVAFRKAITQVLTDLFRQITSNSTTASTGSESFIGG